MDLKKVKKSRNFVDLTVPRKPFYKAPITEAEYALAFPYTSDYNVTPEEINWAVENDKGTLREILYERALRAVREQARKKTGPVYISPPPRK